MRCAAAVFVLASLALVPSAASSATDPLPECGGDKNQMELNLCSAKAFERADAELNDTYKQLMKKLSPDESKLARAAQLAWIAFRDAECISETGGGPNQSGTIWPLIHNECLVDLTRKRTQELREQVKCPGGHLEC